MDSPPQGVPSLTASQLKESGNALFKKGRYLEAIQLYTQALEIDPSSIPLYQNRGLCYLKLSNFPELRANCDVVLQLEPHNIKALVNRSYALGQQGLLSEAIADLRLALSLGADDPSLPRRLKDLERRSQPSLSQNSLPQSSLSQVSLPLSNMSQPSVTQPSIPQPSLSQPTFLQPSFIQPSQSHPSQSQQSLSQPSLPQPTFHQSSLPQSSPSQPSLSQPSQTQPSLSQPTFPQPSLPQPTLLQPTLLQPSLSQPSLLQPTLPQPSLSQPSLPHPNQPPSTPSKQKQRSVKKLKARGNTLFQSQKILQALACYNQALSLDPHNTSLYNNRGMCYLKLGQYNELKANCDAILLIDPANIKALFNRATAWEKLSNLDSALQDLRTALSLEPEDPEILQRIFYMDAQRVPQVPAQSQSWSAPTQLAQVGSPPTAPTLPPPFSSYPQPQCPQIQLVPSSPSSPSPQDAQPPAVLLPPQTSAAPSSSPPSSSHSQYPQPPTALPPSTSLPSPPSSSPQLQYAQPLAALPPGYIFGPPSQLSQVAISIPDPQYAQPPVIPPGYMLVPLPPQVVISMPDPLLSEAVPLLGSPNKSHHSHHPPTVPIVAIRWREYPGIVLSLGLLGLYIYQSTQDLSQYEKKETFAAFFIIEFIGAIIQSINSAYGSLAFLFRSIKALEYYSSTSAGALLWQAIQTICLIVFSQLENAGKITPLTYVAAVVGWLPIITSILAVKLRFLLLTWNVPPQFTYLSDWLCEVEAPQHTHCMPHNLISTARGCCAKIYRCSNCGGEWKRT